MPGCVHTSHVESKSHHVFKHLYFSLYTPLRRPLNCLNTDETAWDIAILRRCRNCNPAGAVTTNRNGSKHSKTRRWLDFFKYILSWHASIVQGYIYVFFCDMELQNCRELFSYFFVVLTSLGQFSGSRGTRQFQFLTFLKGPVLVQFPFLYISNMGPGSGFFLFSSFTNSSFQRNNPQFQRAKYKNGQCKKKKKS